MSRLEGLAYTVRGEDVVITHKGKQATPLRGSKAADGKKVQVRTVLLA